MPLWLAPRVGAASARPLLRHGRGAAPKIPTRCAGSLRSASSPGRNRTYVACPDSKSGGPCQQTNRGPPRALGTRHTGEGSGPQRAVRRPPTTPRAVGHRAGETVTQAQWPGERPFDGQALPRRPIPDDGPRAARAADRHRPQAFADKGFEGTTVEEIAASAGVSQAGRLRALRRQGGPLRRRGRPRDRAACSTRAAVR